MTALSSLPIATILIRLFTIGLGVAIFIDQSGAREFLHLGAGDSVASPAPGDWFGLLAPAFFLYALWSASGVFISLRRGDSFSAAMVKGLNAIGAALMLGAFAAIVVQPSLEFLIGNGFREMRGVRFNLDIEHITLVTIGLVLVLLAREGRELKSSLDEII